MVLEKKYAVACLWRKARNWGYDGSGENCTDGDRDFLKNIHVNIDTRECFKYAYSDPMKIFKVEKHYSPEILCRVIMVFLKLGLWRLKDGT